MHDFISNVGAAQSVAFQALHSAPTALQPHILLFPPRILSDFQLLPASHLEGPGRHLPVAPSVWDEAGQAVRTTVAFQQGQQC